MSRGQDREYKKVDEQMDKVKQNTQLDIQNYENDKNDAHMRQKAEIERKIKNDWLETKREYEKQEEDNRHDY